MRKLKGLVFALALMFATPVFADTICRNYPTDNGKVVGPLLITRPSGAASSSWQIEITSGSGTVGSYQLQKTDGVKFVNQGSAVSSEAITAYTPDAQYFQIIMTAAPQSGTVVKVCLFN